MRKYLLDTGPAQDMIDDRRGIRSRAKTEQLKGSKIGICIPGLGELWAGVEGSNNRGVNLHRLVRWVSGVVVWPYTIDAAEEFGRLSALLKAMGRPMQQIDIQIAAIALTLGNCTVVTMDSDLAAVPGLSVENWATP